MTHAGWNMYGQNIRQKVQIVISGAFNNKSVHFVGVIIVWYVYYFQQIYEAPIISVYCASEPSRGTAAQNTPPREQYSNTFNVIRPFVVYDIKYWNTYCPNINCIWFLWFKILYSDCLKVVCRTEACSIHWQNEYFCVWPHYVFQYLKQQQQCSCSTRGMLKLFKG
jgi:hypothetical protein